MGEAFTPAFPAPSPFSRVEISSMTRTLRVAGM
jgi:hypothetical protein